VPAIRATAKQLLMTLGIAKWLIQKT
jgi:hypothetical protein